jgi:hypothetical protein
MLRLHAIRLLLPLLLVTSAAADEPIIPNGSWYATYSAFGYSYLVDVEVKGTTGSWKTRRVQNSIDPCVGREYPLLISQNQSGVISLRALGAQALVGCSDFVIRLKRQEDGTYVGTRFGSPLLLKRR